MSKKETGRDSAGAKDAVALGSPAVAKVAVLSVCIFGLIEVLRCFAAELGETIMTHLDIRIDSRRERVGSAVLMTYIGLSSVAVGWAAVSLLVAFLSAAG